jgi:hypothetical protein
VEDDSSLPVPKNDDLFTISDRYFRTVLPERTDESQNSNEVEKKKPDDTVELSIETEVPTIPAKLAERHLGHSHLFCGAGSG